VLDRLLLSQKTQVSGNYDNRDCSQVQLDPQLSFKQDLWLAAYPRKADRRF